MMPWTLSDDPNTPHFQYKERLGPGYTGSYFEVVILLQTVLFSVLFMRAKKRDLLYDTQQRLR